MTHAPYVPRPKAQAFAEMMEERLRANDLKGGWQRCDPYWLLQRLREETDELEVALTIGGDAIIHEAADIGNFAMMIVDVCGGMGAWDLVRSHQKAAGNHD